MLLPIEIEEKLEQNLERCYQDLNSIQFASVESE